MTRPHAVRIARHTARLGELVAFYRDGIGLSEIGGFRGHDCYDGVFLDVPGTGAHLELTAGGEHDSPVPHPESLLVLYLGDGEAVEEILRRLDGDPIAPANPYWAEHGVTVADPDGFRVALVPERWTPSAPAPVRIREYDGPRSELLWLFELADDSRQQIDEYIDAGRVFVAVDEGRVVGHLQVTETRDGTALELKNMAVDPSSQRRGVGRALVAAAIDLSRAGQRRALIVATAAADTGNLRFYQRLGFRVRSVERDAFTPATGYPAGVLIDGIALRDRIWLELAI